MRAKIVFVKVTGSGVREIDGIPGTGCHKQEIAIVLVDGCPVYKIRLDVTTNKHGGYECRELTAQEESLPELKTEEFLGQELLVFPDCFKTVVGKLIYHDVILFSGINFVPECPEGRETGLGLVDPRYGY
jgi:hypothetical protein